MWCEILSTSEVTILWCHTNLFIVIIIFIIIMKGTEADLGGRMGSVHGNPSTTVTIHISYYRISKVSFSFISL